MKKEQENNLEQFIRQNREAFDPYEAPQGLWDKIARELEEENRPTSQKKGKVVQIPVRNLYRMAAAVVLIVGFLSVYRLLPQSAGHREDLSQHINLSEIDPELAEAEHYYTKLIAEKKQEIEQFRSQRVPIDNDFYKDLDELDSLYVGLKKELYQVPAKEQVVEAMIQNLRIRIEILNKQLEILNKIQKLQNGGKNNEHKISA